MSWIDCGVGVLKAKRTVGSDTVTNWNGPIRTSMRRAANGGFEPILTNAAERSNVCF